MKQLDLTPYEMKACAFTGHRSLAEDFSDIRLKQEIHSLLEKGVRTFYNGFAVGFDTEAIKAVLSFKEKYPDIKLIACIPCKTQSATLGPTPLMVMSFSRAVS